VFLSTSVRSAGFEHNVFSSHPFLASFRNPLRAPECSV
jgi:hypothetical protein